MKLMFALLCLTALLFASDIKPKKSIKLDSPALDMVIKNSKLYACTEKGDVYEVDSRAKKIYSLPQTTLPSGSKGIQKAFTLDVSSANIAVGAEDGSLYISKGNALIKSGFSTNSVIKKIAFVSDNLVLIGLVSSQVVLFDKLPPFVKTFFSEFIFTFEKALLSNFFHLFFHPLKINIHRLFVS